MTEPTWTTNAFGERVTDLPEGSLIVSPGPNVDTNVVRFAPRGAVSVGRPAQQGWAASPETMARGLAIALADASPSSVEDTAAAFGYVARSALVGGQVRRWVRRVDGGFYTLHVAPRAVWVDYEGERAGWKDGIIHLENETAADGRPVAWPAGLATLEARTLAVVGAAAGHDPSHHPAPPSAN